MSSVGHLDINIPSIADAYLVNIVTVVDVSCDHW